MKTMDGLYCSVVVPHGITSYVAMKGAPLPCSVTAIPLDGDTLTISYSCDDGNNYVYWSGGTSGAVTSLTTVAFSAPITHLKIVCTGTGIASNVAIC